MVARWKNRTEFKNRVKHWADKLDIKVRWLALRPMKKKWASCSTNGNLNFNTELLGLDRDVGDYVIVHELLHFVVPHHGKLWKSLMRAHLGDYERLDGKLKSAVERPTSVRPASLKNTLIRTNTMKVPSDGQ
jgi:predicted metal-dependent hydrolase